MRLLPAVLMICCVSSPAPAQTGSVGLHREVVMEIVRAVESKFACRVTLYGEPRHEEFSRRWSVNYSASGDDCEEASAELRRQGEELEILFFHRPNIAQLRALASNMTRSIGFTFGCQMAIKGEPRLEPSTGRWYVTYLASGEGCDAAADELRRQGEELDLGFLRRSPPVPVRDIL